MARVVRRGHDDRTEIDARGGNISRGLLRVPGAIARRFLKIRVDVPNVDSPEIKLSRR
jgi:hypothetical protein